MSQDKSPKASKVENQTESDPEDTSVPESDGVAAKPQKPKRKRKPVRDKFDIRSTVKAHVKLKKNGKTKTMPPYEAIMRQQARKGLVDQAVPSLKMVVDEIEKYDLVEKPGTGPQGGVYHVPKWFPEELQKKIADQELIPLNDIAECYTGDTDALKQKFRDKIKRLFKSKFGSR